MIGITQASAGCILVVLFLFYYLSILWKRRHDYILSLKLPGPFAFPIIGSCHLLYKLDENINRLDSFCETYKSPFGLWLGSEYLVCIYEPEDAEMLLKTSINRPNIFRFIKHSLGFDGLFTLKGNHWKSHRRLIAPSFGLKTIYEHLPIFNDYIERMIGKMSKYLNQSEPFNVRMPIADCTTKMFIEAVLGSNITEDEREYYTMGLTRGQTLISKRLFLPWYRIDWIWNRTSYSKDILKYQSFGSNLIKNITSGRRLENQFNSLSFVDRLVNVSEENTDFTLQDVRNESQALLIAGSDTSAVGISFTILMLAIHSEYQERVFNELVNEFPSKNNMYVSREKMEKLIFTEKCIKEALRLFPVVSMLGREAEHDIQLKNVLIPKGTTVFVCLRQLQMNKRIWGSDAKDYRPDRFDSENMADKHPFSFMPFGEGPRNCIGYKYATVAVKTMVIHLLRNYQFTSKLTMDDLKIRLDINLHLINGHLVNIRQRNV